MNVHAVAVMEHSFRMAVISTVLLSDNPDRVEPARALLEEYLRLPDAWERFGGVPESLPVVLQRDVEAFPRLAVPPEGDVVLGLVSAEDVVAFGQLVQVEPGVCELKRMYVRPDYRRNGAGTQVAETLIQRARTLGYRRIVLDVMPERTAAIALWAGVGFRSCAPYRTYPFPMAFMAIDLEKTSPGP